MISFANAITWDNVAYYKMDETSGTILDSTINSYDSILIREVVAYGATGIINDAMYLQTLNGANWAVTGYLSFPSTILTDNNIDSGSNVSVSFWANRSTLSSDTGALFTMGSNSGSQAWGLVMEGGNICASTPGFNDCIAHTFNVGTYYHIVGIFNGTGTLMYVDSVYKGYEPRDITIGGDLFYIGTAPATNSNYNGTIDEFGLWNRSLNPTEITDLYNLGGGVSFEGISTLVPTIILELPTNDTTISDVGTNFTVSGNNLTTVSGTWANLTYYVWKNGTLDNSTTISLSGETFNETQFIDSFNFTNYEWNAQACYTNVTDSYCLTMENNNTFSVSVFTIVEENYVTETVSGTLENFSISIDLLEGYDLSQAIFIYNGSEETPTITATGDNRYLLVSDYQIPTIIVDENMTFHWDLTFTGGIQLNSTTRTQLVRAVLLDNCSVYTYELFNLGLFDEEEKTSITGDIELIYNILNVPSYDIVNTLFYSINNVSSTRVCSAIDLTGEGLAYSAEIRYVSTGYVPELYHIQRAAISSDTQNISLYDLNSSQSTEFKITYQDNSFNFVEGAIVQLQRKYIAENAYEVVEAPLTSRDGVAVVHIDLDSIKYKVTIVKDGVVLDIFDNIVFDCESELTGECTQKLLGEVNPHNSADITNLIDFSYSVSSVNNTITTTFSVPSGTPSNINILLTQVDSFGTTTLCNRTIISSAGSVDCDYNDTIGDSRVYLTITKDGELYVNEGYFIAENIDLGFAGNNYLIVLVLLLTLIGMAFASPEWIVIIGIVAFVIAGGLWLINGMNLVIGLGMVIFVIIAAVILIKEMTKQEDR